MKKIKKVLIALDYDPTSQKVAESGFSLANSLGAETILYHVISDSNNYASPEHVTILGFAGHLELDITQLESIDGLKKASHQFLDKLKKHLTDDSIKTLVGEGEYAESILNTAKEIHADIIVMGSHSKKWLENIIMGSVTEKVLHHTTIPLFVVPTKKLKG